MKKISWFLVLLIVISLFPVKAQAAGGAVWETTKQTSSAFNKFYPTMEVVGSEVYMMWAEPDGSSVMQVWTAKMDLDGSNFVATKRTNSTVSLNFPNFDVDGTKIYMVWEGGSPDGIYTAEMNTDGTGFVATQRYSGGNVPTLKVSGSKIYYTFFDSNQVYTAEMNTDGTGFTATQRTSGPNLNREVTFDISGSKMYLGYKSYNFGISESNIYTAEMNLDGTGWSTTLRETHNNPGVFTDPVRVLAHTDGRLYYFWPATSGGVVQQLYTGESDLNGANWSSQQRTFDGSKPQYGGLLAGDGNNVFYAWVGSDGTNSQIFTSAYDIDDGEWRPTQRTDNAFSLLGVGFDISGSKIYYVYSEDDGSNYQIWTTVESNIQTINDSTTVTASVPSSLTFTVAGVSSGAACANSGGNASVTTTASTIPFGTYTGAATKIACQTLTVSTNATDGYVITVEQNQDMTSGGSDIMDKFSGTYAVPTTWSSPSGSGTESYFGFTTDDTDYSDFQTSKYGSFGVNDTPYNIAMETDPVQDEINVMSYQLEVTDLQESGVYTNNVMYIATAIF